MSVFTVIECDKCGSRIVFNRHVPKYRAIDLTRRDGWTSGKRDLCPECKSKKHRGVWNEWKEADHAD